MREKLVNLISLVSAVVGLVAGVKTAVDDVFIGYLMIGAALILVAYPVYLWLRRRPEPYRLRAMEHTITIDLLDKTGTRAVQTRSTRFRSLVDGVDTFTDHMSADGAYEDLHVSTGAIEGTRREGGDLFITTRFERVLKKGDEAERTMSATLLNSFTGNPEYWSIRIVVPTDRFIIRVIFPIDRPCQSFQGLQRITSHEKLCEKQPVRAVINGRPALEWTVGRPDLKDVYKIVWHW